MLPDFKESLQIDEVTGVLMGTLQNFDMDKPLKAWQLSHGASSLPVVVPSNDLLHQVLSQPLALFEFRVVTYMDRTQEPAQSVPVVVEAEPLNRIDALDYLPRDFCPIRGVLPEVISLITEIKTAPLRQMVRNVLAERDVCAHYWTMPASARHHHAHPGGLAEHSLQVAEDIATQGQLTDIERDLGIAAGLLHDIGKIWAYTSDMFPSAGGKAMGHELLGLARIERHLGLLEAHWPDGAFAMRVLLSGCSRIRSDGAMPPALIARLRACDQRSCERDPGHPARQSRSWVPKPWLPYEPHSGSQ